MELTEEQLGVLRRLLTESASALLNYKVLEELDGYPRFDGRHEGVTRREVVYRALDEDIRVRLVRLLDLSKFPQVRSFTSLLGELRNEIEAFCTNEGLDITAIERLAERVKPLRDQTIMHIDLVSTQNPPQLWKDANIKWPEVYDCLNTIWKTCDHLYPKTEQRQVLPPEFLPDDPPIEIGYPPVESWDS